MLDMKTRKRSSSYSRYEKKVSRIIALSQNHFGKDVSAFLSSTEHPMIIYSNRNWEQVETFNSRQKKIASKNVLHVPPPLDD